jgi:serine/threonine-protein kinase HipA
MKSYHKEFVLLIEKMKKIMSSKEVIVSISLDSENIRVGKLWFHARNNKESASFEYDKEWLDHPEKFAREPASRDR